MQRHAARMVVALVALTLGASAASAQGSIQLERFRPSETPEGGFALSRPDDQGHMRVGAQLAHAVLAQRGRHRAPDRVRVRQVRRVGAARVRLAADPAQTIREARH